MSSGLERKKGRKEERGKQTKRQTDKETKKQRDKETKRQRKREITHSSRTHTSGCRTLALAQYGLAQAYVLKGKNRRAAMTFEKALALAPDDRDVSRRGEMLAA